MRRGGWGVGQGGATGIGPVRCGPEQREKEREERREREREIDRQEERWRVKWAGAAREGERREERE